MCSRSSMPPVPAQAEGGIVASPRESAGRFAPFVCQARRMHEAFR